MDALPDELVDDAALLRSAGAKDFADLTDAEIAAVVEAARADPSVWATTERMAAAAGRERDARLARFDTRPTHERVRVEVVVDIEAEARRRKAATAHLTDAGNAEVFVALRANDVRFDHARRRWLVWEGHRWRPDTDAEVRRLALDALRARLRAAGDEMSHESAKKLATHALRSESRGGIDAMLSLAGSMKPIADDGEGWDCDVGLLGVPNGVVDLRTGELRDGRPEDRITMQAGAEYDPAAECPRWERFVSEVFSGDAEMVRYVKRLAGYAITGEAALDIALFLMGVGENGKTTLLETLQAAAGDYGREIAATALSDETRAAHSTEVTDLAGCRFATCEEMGDRKLNTDRFKHLTGGGQITARRIRENTVTFPVTWMLWITTNGLPRSDDNSRAFWRRVEVIPFDETFDRTREPNLRDTLVAELPGIVRWLVEGAAEYYRDGLGERPARCVEATAEYREQIDPLEPLFESGALVLDPEAFTPTTELYAAYLAWAREHLGDGIPRVGEDTFAKRLGARFTRKRARTDGGQARGFQGVRTSVFP